MSKTNPTPPASTPHTGTPHSPCLYSPHRDSPLPLPTLFPTPGLPTPPFFTPHYIFEELPEMHPLDFRDYWGLTNEEAAYYLRVTAAAIGSMKQCLEKEDSQPGFWITHPN